MTPNREDYLKIIYELKGTELVKSTEIANALEVSKASVSEMIRKLERDGLITHQPYKGVALTSEGVRLASNLLRVHRLWEVFLVEKLQMDWTNVHSDAEILEHDTRVEISDALEKFLGEPEYCPHGGIIARKNMPVSEPFQNNLWDATSAHPQTFIIKRVVDNESVLEFLSQNKLRLQVKFEVVHKSENELIVQFENKKIAIAKEFCQMIFVTEE
jgi:DtxR family Mn-dependent transcriptional regulator